MSHMHVERDLQIGLQELTPDLPSPTPQAAERNDRLTVTTLLVLTASEDAAMRILIAGFYRCDLIRKDDVAWRIATFRGGYDIPY